MYFQHNYVYKSRPSAVSNAQCTVHVPLRNRSFYINHDHATKTLRLQRLSEYYTTHTYLDERARKPSLCGTDCPVPPAIVLGPIYEHSVSLRKHKVTLRVRLIGEDGAVLYCLQITTWWGGGGMKVINRINLSAINLLLKLIDNVFVSCNKSKHSDQP